MSGPFKGVKVLDLSQVASGPYTTMLLADMGADVIKVERPRVGDAIRHAEIGTKGISGFYVGLNKGKRSVALDLQSERGRRAVLALARWADVVIENFRPGTADRLGIGYESLRAVNPQIIFCSISGYGPSGPMRDRPAYDIIAQALSGIMDITGEPDRGPAKCGAPIADLSAGVFAALGIAAALYHRGLSGEGQRVDTSLLGATIGLLASYLPAAALGTDIRRLGSAHNTVTPYEAFRGSDGRYFIVAAGSDEFWRRTAAAIGLEPLATDPRFVRNRERMARRHELTGLLQRRFESGPAEQWVDKLSAVGVPSCLVYSLSDVLSDQHIRQVGYVRDIEHATVGKVPVTVAPFAFSATPIEGERPAPSLDQHGEEVWALIRSVDPEVGEGV